MTGKTETGVFAQFHKYKQWPDLGDRETFLEPTFAADSEPSRLPGAILASAALPALSIQIIPVSVGYAV